MPDDSASRAQCLLRSADAQKLVCDFLKYIENKQLLSEKELKDAIKNKSLFLEDTLFESYADMLGRPLRVTFDRALRANREWEWTQLDALYGKQWIGSGPTLHLHYEINRGRS